MLIHCDQIDLVQKKTYMTVSAKIFIRQNNEFGRVLWKINKY